MKHKRIPLKIPRTKAFIKQNGLCYYCHLPMWNISTKELSIKFKVSKKNLSNFKCTGEHLTPHSEGGSANQSNIVAACWFCNSKRHQRKTIPNDEEYHRFVQKRVHLGKWNTNYISTQPTS
jgi:5-methylcytosine-specific restriction endonuclease McrA